MTGQAPGSPGEARRGDPRGASGPTSPDSANFASALRHNIAILRQRREAEEQNAGREQKLADAVTRFSGSIRFAYIHLALFGAWVMINLGLVPWVPRFDPSFVILATFASVEAIFLSTFVLVSQNRASAAAERRANLDLQISLLAEREVTRLVRLTSAIAEHLGIPGESDPELHEMKHDVAPDTVLDAIERDEEQHLR